jgi:hypothetical protein
MPDDKVTLNFETGKEKLDEMDALMAECGFAARKEFLNNAITFFKWAVRHSKDGHAIAAIDEGSSKYHELQMPVLDRLRAAAPRAPSPDPT